MHLLWCARHANLSPNIADRAIAFGRELLNKHGIKLDHIVRLILNTDFFMLCNPSLRLYFFTPVVNSVNLSFKNLPLAVTLVRIKMHNLISRHLTKHNLS